MITYDKDEHERMKLETPPGQPYSSAKKRRKPKVTKKEVEFYDFVGPPPEDEWHEKAAQDEINSLVMGSPVVMNEDGSVSPIARPPIYPAEKNSAKWTEMDTKKVTDVINENAELLLRGAFEHPIPPRQADSSAKWDASCPGTRQSSSVSEPRPPIYPAEWNSVAGETLERNEIVHDVTVHEEIAAKMSICWHS